MGLLEILALTLPVMAVILFGYSAVRTGAMPVDMLGALGLFVRRFVLPIAIFHSLSRQSMVDVFDGGFVLAFGLASLASFGLTFWIGRGLGQQGLSLAAFLALAAATSNSLMIGFPLVTPLFGDKAVLAIALQLIIENAVVIPVALLLAEAGQGEGGVRWARVRTLLQSIATNPVVLGMTAGLLFSVLPYKMPEPASRSLEIVAAATSGVALFFIGGSLVGISLKGALGPLLPVVVVKMFVHPVLVTLAYFGVNAGFLALGWRGIDPVVAYASIITASLPSIGIVPAMASRFGLQGPLSLALMLMSLISALSTPLAIWLILHFKPLG